ncbi:uncharacterized protein LOC113127722 isoform X2 [Mastacembelus armatus]|uniref:uncharacterized protein LOC113127722 isoform X2 n=1 Tax=Mastacembelus armatus TaxID=205130 RepID=UPI000E465D81|nr:uncharacterized protein LOC113127722 isoform X2 [Mastacembelus armatus]
MTEIHIYICLLSALTVVQMKSLHITGHVGKNVTISCSDWNSWTDVNSKVKYFCVSPCNYKDIIVKAAPGESKKKDRIHVTNTNQYLNVTFTGLQISDSKQYYCGLEVFGLDTLIEVTLEVTNGPQTTAQTVTVKSAVSLAESAPYLIVGSIFIITIMMVLLMFTVKLIKKKIIVKTTQEEIEGESVHSEGIYQSLHLSMEEKDQVYDTLTPNKREQHTTHNFE